MKKSTHKRKKKADNRSRKGMGNGTFHKKKVFLWSMVGGFALLCVGALIFALQSHKTDSSDSSIETVSWNMDLQNPILEEDPQTPTEMNNSQTEELLASADVSETGEGNSVSGSSVTDEGNSAADGENDANGKTESDEETATTTENDADGENDAEEITEADVGATRENAGETDVNEEDAVRRYMEATPAGTVITGAQVDMTSIDRYFCVYEISDAVYNRINGKSYRENEDIAISDLRYIKLLHYNFDHELQVGELIVNKSIATDVVNIFRELFHAEYEIQSMYLIDRYWTGDEEETDTASIDANNTSAFFYRRIAGSSKLSKHAMGLAIDINPQQNPYVSYRTGCPVCIHENALSYIDRTTGAEHMILSGDVCYEIFAKYGFTWGGNWNTIKDYQHFER